MRLSRNVLAAGAAIGLLAAAGTAVAQDHATRMVRVPANAVVLVLPPGAHVLSPGATDAAAPEGFGMAPWFGAPWIGLPGFATPGAAPSAGGQWVNALFEQMDAAMRSAQHQLAMPGTLAPGRTFQAMMRDMPPGAVRSVTVTSFSDGSQHCTQRVVYGGSGAPVIQTSGNACRVMTRRPLPAAAPESAAPQGPRLIEAAAHRVVAER